MGNPYVYYRLDPPGGLKRDPSFPVRELDWYRDLAAIQRFYARFTDTPIDPGGIGPDVGNPLAVMEENEIVSFAIPFSFREGETEMGAVATVPDRRNMGYCKALLTEMAFRILSQGRAAVLTTDRNNAPMRAAAAAIGMKEMNRTRG